MPTIDGGQRRIFLWPLHNLFVQEPIEDALEKGNGWDCEPFPPKKFLNVPDINAHRRNTDGIDHEDVDITIVATRHTRSVVLPEIELTVIIEGFTL